jgi:hypothetical protein
VGGALAIALVLAMAGPSDSLAVTRAGRALGAASGHSSAGTRTHVALRVIPFPGTPDASRLAEIIFPSLPRRDLRSLKVSGLRSGQHAGRLMRLPGSTGTAFTPSEPYDPGERVTVNARLRSRQFGAAVGDPGAKAISFSFRVQVADNLTASASAHAARKASAAEQTQSFHSAPALHPPAVSVGADPDTSSGDILLAPGGGSQHGPMILDSQGRLLWFHPIPNLQVDNLQVQRYQGRSVLTWWQGVLVWGTDVIMNRSYRAVATVRGAEGYSPDVHEFQITPRGTALVDAYALVKTNLTSVGGPRKGTMWDCIIQELDIRTGQLLWEWHALGHIPLSASHEGKPHGSAPYDPFHLNSIQQLPGGDLLISTRDTWAVYKIDRATGRVVWSLGGKHSSFRMGRGTKFEWQHDARLSGHTLSLFDDGAAPQEESQSSAKVLHINTHKMTASLIRRYTHSPPLLAELAGSTQILTNHDVFVGWGGAPDFSEYTPGGRQIFSGSFALGVSSYRAFRSPWSGQPVTRPALAVTSSSRRVVWVYASWNGATGVARWGVLGGPTAQDLRTFGRWPTTGFETAIKLRGRPRYVKVQALGPLGKLLGTSAPSAVQ